MVIILLSWIFLTLLFITTGVVVSKLFAITAKLPMLCILGMFGQTVLLSICCFFTNISITIFIANTIASLILAYSYRYELRRLLRDFHTDFTSLKAISKAAIFIVLFTAAIKCAQAPFIIDNESYYIQTVKWINEYGYVKGLANLHVYLAQCSPWHILQAGCNFNFITNNFNDINGLLLLFCTLFFFMESERIVTNGRNMNWIGLFPMFNLLLFFFVDSPSPDFPLLLVTPIIFYFFVEKQQENFTIAALLLAFLIFVKLTLLPVALLLLFLKLQPKHKRRVVGLGFVLGIILVLKNSLLSGYPFYPFQWFPIESTWTLPTQMWDFMRETTQDYAWYKNNIPENPGTIIDKLAAWIQLGGIDSIFNKGMILLFLVFPMTKSFQRFNERIAYLIFLLHFILLLFISPQFRFFLPGFLTLSALFAADLFQKFPVAFSRTVVIAGILVPVFLIIGVDLSNVSANKNLHKSVHFAFSQLLAPAPNTKFTEIGYGERQIGNLKYYTPDQNFMFFGTADGPLPCVNEIQLNHLKRKYHMVPQMKGTIIGEGFQSVILEKQ